MAINPERFIKAKRFDTADFILDDATDKVKVNTAALTAGLPDASATVRGLVNLTDLQVLGANRKVIDGIHVGRGNLAHAGRATVTAVGSNAGANNTGASATQTGHEAGQNNTGANATQTGAYAGSNNTGASATQTGYAAGRNNTGANATQTGYAAGQNNRGLNTSFFGYATGASAGPLIGTFTLTPSSATGGTISPAVPASLVGQQRGVSIPAYDNRVLTFTSTTEYTTVAGPSTGTWNITLYDGLNFDNVTVLGANANPTDSNQVTLGDNAVTSVRTSGAYTGTGFITSSDATLKEQVTDVDPAKALAFRSGLKWKRYELFSEDQVEIMETVKDEEGNESQVPTGRYEVKRHSQGFQYGLIAQDVAALAKSIGAFEDVVKVTGTYLDLDAEGYPVKDKDGKPVKKDRYGLDYPAINVIVMTGEQAALMG